MTKWEPEEWEAELFIDPLSCRKEYQRRFFLNGCKFLDKEKDPDILKQYLNDIEYLVERVKKDIGDLEKESGLNKKYKNSFLSWLLSQSNIDSPIGDIARDFKEDKSRPRTNSGIDRIRRYLEAIPSLAEGYMECFERAVVKYNDLYKNNNIQWSNFIIIKTNSIIYMLNTL